jgi:hypothetical protein
VIHSDKIKKNRCAILYGSLKATFGTLLVLKSYACAISRRFALDVTRFATDF